MLDSACSGDYRALAITVSSIAVGEWHGYDDLLR